MKAELKGKKIQLTLTKKELNTLLSALDSCSTAHSYLETDIYKDVPILEKKLAKKLYELGYDFCDFK